MAKNQVNKNNNYGNPVIFNGENIQSGRSMVEMLGTLAIIGVLSAGAIGGYSYAMNKHRTNELIYEATKRAQWVGTQLDMNNSDPSLAGFGSGEFGGGTFDSVLTNLPNGQIGITVTGLKEAVCENIQNSIAENTVIRAIKDSTGTGDITCDEGVSATLVFNRDLSTSDSEITPNEPEVSGEVSEQAGVATEATATQDPDDVHCNGNGSWNGSSCYCDPDWGGTDCSIDMNCNGRGSWADWSHTCYCDMGWGGDDCSEDHRNDCSGHGYWCGGSCFCDSGWGGNDCSIQNPCNENSGHGQWCGSYCSCNSGWGGDDCSIQQ